MEAFWTACLPTYRKAKSWIHEGMIGELKEIKLSFCFKAEENPQSRLFNKELGGGALYDLGIYGIGLTLDFFSEYPDYTDADITYSSTGVDIRALLSLSYSRNRSAQLEFDFTNDKPQDALLIGTKRTIKLPDFWHGTKVICIEGDKIYKEEEYKHQANGYEYEVQEVCDCLNNRKLTSQLVSPELTIKVSQLIKEKLSRV